MFDQGGQRRSKLRFSDGSDHFFWRRVLDEDPGPSGAATPAERRVLDGSNFFRAYVDGRKAALGDRFGEWLLEVHNKVAHRLMFSPYYVSDPKEVGVIFEVMNDRGRPLSDMDLVKNYVLYLGQQLTVPEDVLHDDVSHTWKLIFTGLMQAGLGTGGNEDQLLRSHWRMAYDPAPRWKGTHSVKTQFRLRHYVGNHTVLLSDLREYVKTLGDASVAYCDVFAPWREGSFAPLTATQRVEVMRMSDCLLRTGVVAIFLPILLATRLRHADDGHGYLQLVQACERYAFRVNRLRGVRADAGQSRLFQIGHNLFRGAETPAGAAAQIQETSLHYCSETEFRDAFQLSDEGDWYGWGGLRYFLYEYERGRTSNEDLAITWAELHAVDRQQTIEHILPQTPTSEWEVAFDESARQRYTHDLGNLCLTQDNSSYGNKPFASKKGYPGASFRCYANGKLQMERDLYAYTRWTPEELLRRREGLVQWAFDRWGLPGVDGASDVDELAADDERVEELDSAA